MIWYKASLFCVEIQKMEINITELLHANSQVYFAIAGENTEINKIW